jgi:hypothetical protein
MIEEHIFDGTIGREEGIDILAKICENGMAIWYSGVYGVLTSCIEKLRQMMLYPKNPPTLDNDSWNFGGKDARQQQLKKAANYVREKTIDRLVGKPARNDSDKPQYPRNIIGILRKMIGTTQLDSIQNSAISYLRIIVNHGWSACCCQAFTLIKIQRTHVRQ